MCLGNSDGHHLWWFFWHNDRHKSLWLWPSCCYTLITRLLHCCYNCCYTALTLCYTVLHCVTLCYTVLHCCYTVVIPRAQRLESFVALLRDQRHASFDVLSTLLWTAPVTVVIHSCRGVTMVFQWCKSCVSVVLDWYNNTVRVIVFCDTSWAPTGNFVCGCDPLVCCAWAGMGKNMVLLSNWWDATE
jgi:hypothetical protein